MQASWLTGGSGQIAADQLLQKLVPIQLGDHTAGVVVVGDVGGVLGQQIADDLIHRIVALFLQSVEDGTKGAAHIVLVVAGYDKFLCILVRHGVDLLGNSGYIIAQIFVYVKGQYVKIFFQRQKGNPG